GWFAWAVVAAGPLSLVALICGWVTTEVGRQPWVVYDVMRTSQAVTGAGGIPVGYATLVVVYVALAFAVAWILMRLQRRPLDVAGQPPPVLDAHGPRCRPGDPDPRRDRSLHRVRRRGLRRRPVVPAGRTGAAGPAGSRLHLPRDGARVGGQPRVAHLRPRGDVDGLSDRVRLDRLDARRGALHRGRRDHHSRHRLRHAQR